MGGGIEHEGGLVMVTEMLVSQTPVGMSKGQKDTSLLKVRVKSTSRGILGIWFGASRIKSYERLNVNTCSTIVAITEEKACG